VNLRVKPREVAYFYTTDIENYLYDKLKLKVESGEVEVEVPDAIKAVVGYVK
jgi:hypothetical protein